MLPLIHLINILRLIKNIWFCCHKRSLKLSRHLNKDIPFLLQQTQLEKLQKSRQKMMKTLSRTAVSTVCNATIIPSNHGSQIINIHVL